MGISDSDDDMIDALMRGPSSLSLLPDLDLPPRGSELAPKPKVILTGDEAVAFMVSLPFCRTKRTNGDT